jgi:23S rRNA (guanine745-N1)-methyltransferase
MTRPPACHYELMLAHQSGHPTAPWVCPVCRDRLALGEDGRRWICRGAHSFDVAREGYVHLWLAGQRRQRQPGDSPEMVKARHRFLASGAFDPLTDAIADAVARERPTTVLDVGCGDGRHTRSAPAPMVIGVDVAKSAVALAAHAHPDGWYAVASAADLPLADAAVDMVLNVFGPVVPMELARVLRSGGTVVAVHPGPAHLEDLRNLVYEDGRPHDVKPPLRSVPEWFAEVGTAFVSFQILLTKATQLHDLFAMTPYSWQASPALSARLADAAAGRFETRADIHLTTYRRTDRPIIC